MRKPAGYWTDKRVREAAVDCAHRTDFKINQRSAYAAAKRLGILEELFDTTYHYWSDSEIRRVAAGCSSRKEFREKHYPAYLAAQRRGIYYDAVHHLPCERQSTSPEAPTCVYIFRTPYMRAYVGITTDIDYRIDRHVETGSEITADVVKSAAPEFSDRYGSVATSPEYMPRHTARELEVHWINKLAEDGWHLTNKLDNPQYDRTRGDWDWPELPWYYYPEFEDAMYARE